MSAKIAWKINSTLLVFVANILMIVVLCVLFGSVSAEPKYVSIMEIFPSQLRYSSLNVQEKMKSSIKKGRAAWDDVHGSWQCQYSEGASTLPLTEALPVIRASFGYVLVDGHHDVLTGLALGAKMMPINVVDDMSELSEEAFWAEAENRGYAYLYDIQGNHRFPPHDFKWLEDDPNRFFAAVSARKCSSLAELENSTGAEFPLWIKVGKDIPFIEFRIADVLRQHGLVYSSEMGLNPPAAFVEEAREILIDAQIPGLKLVSERKRYTELAH